MIIIIYIAVLLLGFSTGRGEAFNKESYPACDYDKHFYYMITRIIAGVFMVISYTFANLYFYGNSIELIIKIVMMAAGSFLIFSFWHDGFYYTYVNELRARMRVPLRKRYPKGWKSNADGDAKHDFTFKQRNLFFKIGNLIFIILIIKLFI